MLVNASGCLAMGFLFVLLLDRFGHNGVLRAGILIGLLGGYTTFSSFSIETFNLIEQGEIAKAGLYMLGSLALGIPATWLGVIIGRQI